MQMTMTFSFDDANEASVFFGQMSTVFADAGNAVAKLFKPKATAKPEPLAKYAVPLVNTTAFPPQSVPELPPEPAAKEELPAEQMPVAVEPVAAAAAATPKARRKRTSHAHEVSDAVASGGLEKVTEPVAEPAKVEAAKPEQTRKKVTIELLREMVNRVSKDKNKGGAASIYKILHEKGVKKLPDLTEDQMQEVYAELRKLDIDDTIPF